MSCLSKTGAATRRGAHARAGLEPKRGAGSAVAAKRSGAALILGKAKFGSVADGNVVGPDGLVFAGAKGGQLRRSNFSKPWARALAKAGISADLHVHDLRHTGNTLTAEAGASLGEMMSRMGHSSTRAAQVYLHARQARDEQLAATLNKMARRELRQSVRSKKAGQSGTQRARGCRSGPGADGNGQE